MGLKNFWQYNFMTRSWLPFTSCDAALATEMSTFLMKTFPNTMIVMSAEMPKFDVNFV